MREPADPPTLRRGRPRARVASASTVALRPARARARLVRPLLIAGAIALADQATKSLAVSRLDDGPSELFWGIQFRLSRNPGSAFSLFQSRTVVLALLSVALVVVLVRLAGKAESLAASLGLAAVLGGALGNLSDRIFRTPGFLRGHVVDFIKVPHWPSFNIADSAITVGAIVLVVWGWTRRDDDHVAAP
jgi:signal peptidase II